MLVVQAATRALNPTVSQDVIDRAYAEDEATASAEYGAQFRTDVESFIARDALATVVVLGRFELPPVSDRAYVAFVDPAGGSGGDSMTLAIAHSEDGEAQSVAVLDCVREVRPPFSPEATVEDFAALLTRYQVSRVQGDAYAGDWPREAFSKHGIDYERSERTKAEIYREFLPLANSRRIELLADRRLLAQLGNLERRPARGGKDSIDHPPGAHDDVANAAAGALVLADQHRTRFFWDDRYQCTRQDIGITI